MPLIPLVSSLQQNINFISLGRHLVHHVPHIWVLYVVFPTISTTNFFSLCAHGHLRLHVLACNHGNAKFASRNDRKQQGRRSIGNCEQLQHIVRLLL